MAPGTATSVSADALRPLSRRQEWLAILLTALAYASVAALSLAVALPPGYASALWPPAGIALAALLLCGPRVWPGILLGAAVANFGVTGTAPLTALAIGTGNAAEALAAAWLLRRAAPASALLDKPAAVWKFAAVAFAAPLIAATSGVATLVAAGSVPLPQFGAHWITWWLGDATGIVIVTPLVLAWRAPGAAAGAARPFERQLFAALLVLCGAFAWATRFPAETVQTLAYLMIPLVTWAAARLDRRAVLTASVAISAVAVLDMLDGSAALFSRLALTESLLLLQLFVSAVALAGLTLSAYAGELERTRRLLEAALARSGPVAAPAATPAQAEVQLKPREREVLALLAEGHTSAEVGRLVHLSPRTIESYRARLQEKLGVQNFAQLVQYAVRHGLTSRVARGREIS